MWLSWRHGLPLGTGIWGGEDAEFEPRRLRRTWRLSRFWPTTWNQSQSVSPSGYLIWLAASAAPSTDCPPAAQHETPSRQGSLCCRCRCSLRGCRPSRLAAVGAVVLVPVPCTTYRLPRSFAGCFRRWRRGLLLVPVLPGGRGKFLRRAWPSFWAVRQLAAPAVAWLWWSTPAAARPPVQFASTRGQQPAARQQLATRSRSLLQKEKRPGSPGKPVAAVARAAPGVAGGSRSARCRRPCLAGQTPAPHRLCRLSRGRSASCKNPSSACPIIRPQSETKHYGVREDLSRQMSATGVLQPNGRRDHVTDRRECFRSEEHTSELQSLR